MARHRDRIGIMADVLKAAGKGARKTRIMRTANLSNRLLRKYLDEAVALGYLTISQEEYGVTEEGDAFLKKYAEYASRYSSVRRELESMKLEKEELMRMCTSSRVVESGSIERDRRLSATTLESHSC
jgi:predicted transcriptional regulator